jgi:hypothetical protein
MLVQTSTGCRTLSQSIAGRYTSVIAPSERTNAPWYESTMMPDDARTRITASLPCGRTTFHLRSLRTCGVGVSVCRCVSVCVGVCRCVGVKLSIDRVSFPLSRRPRALDRLVCVLVERALFLVARSTPALSLYYLSPGHGPAPG